MRGRIVGGLVGWLCGVLPLATVNLAAMNGVFSNQVALAPGAVALVGGMVLGGVLAGYLAGKARPGQPGGPGAALVAGVIAGTLVAITLAGTVAILEGQSSETRFLLRNRTGIIEAIAFCVLILVFTALFAGMFAGQSQDEQASRPRPGQVGRPQRPAVSARGRERTGAYGDAHGNTPSRPTHTGRYSSPARSARSGPRPSAPSSGHSNRTSASDAGWSDDSRW